jgi:hypothetical protein
VAFFVSFKIIFELRYFIYLSFVLTTVSCKRENTELFLLTDPKQTGIDFSNDVPYTDEFNTYTYRNFYNGGGVALGDINNDGLTDIYFTGNIGDNKLFLNKGDWKFEDITKMAGVGCEGVWSTGATMVDINADGWLDIYVCKAGKPEGAKRHNELFINQGDGTFVEQAKEYGLDITGLSIHSAFFDYDKDGDLDCYLLNNSLRSVGGFDLDEGQRNIPDPEGNKLLRNENGKFVDVSREAGIYSSKIGYGLGITVSDFNGDSYPDIFISNDFFEKDYMYINQRNGTFAEKSDSCFASISMGSMGADASDLNNDLLPDLFVTEMLPRDHIRKKTKNIYETWDKYSSSVDNGYHHQYSRNALHKNLDGNRFFEISRFAGVADTDWSWASLAQDYDNDGLKDLFVSNGIYKDLLDKDYLNYTANAGMIKSKIDLKEKVLTMLVDSMPSVPVKNCMFKNKGDFKFEMVSDEWGLGTPSFSNGSAYADLDNDGDLDLVVNNVNMPAFVYKNQLDTAVNRSIRFRLEGAGSNTFGIGAKVLVTYSGNKSMIENYTSRGFQSCVESILHTGVGNAGIIDTVEVFWPDGRYSVLTNLKSNKTYTINQKNALRQETTELVDTHDPFCMDAEIKFKHNETNINLFTTERLLMEMNGFDGPALAVADLNGDKIEDIFCGGGKNQPSVLFLSNGNQFAEIKTPFDLDYRSEAVKAEFFDSDNDGDLDLYVAHGGMSFSEFSPELHDVLYINQGNGVFKKAGALPFPEPVYTGAIAIEDINNDGMKDIIVGEKMKTSLFGPPGSVYILLNKGSNQFTCEVPEGLKNIGMISGIVVVDLNNDRYKDIVFSGKWLGIHTVMNNKGSFNTSKVVKLPGTNGLWNTMTTSDIDGDGDEDILCGNVGLNTFYKKGLKMYINDFDANGTKEQIVAYPVEGKYYAIHDPDELYSQMPSLKKKYLGYKNFASADLTKLFSAELLESAYTAELEELRSVVLVNKGGVFDKLYLPSELQYSSIYAFLALKTKNGSKLYAGGNQYKVKPQYGRQDASLGWEINIKKANESVTFAAPKPLYINGQLRTFRLFNNKLAVGVNDGFLKLCSLNQ